jgi:hypothetical protein
VLSEIASNDDDERTTYVSTMTASRVLLQPRIYVYVLLVGSNSCRNTSDDNFAAALVVVIYFVFLRIETTIFEGAALYSFYSHVIHLAQNLHLVHKNIPTVEIFQKENRP